MTQHARVLLGESDRRSTGVNAPGTLALEGEAAVGAGEDVLVVGTAEEVGVEMDEGAAAELPNTPARASTVRFQQ
jgi:hypothetical protein